MRLVIVFVCTDNGSNTGLFRIRSRSVFVTTVHRNVANPIRENTRIIPTASILCIFQRFLSNAFVMSFHMPLFIRQRIIILEKKKDDGIMDIILVIIMLYFATFLMHV